MHTHDSLTCRYLKRRIAQLMSCFSPTFDDVLTINPEDTGCVLIDNFVFIDACFFL